jgi:hypothetical protein
MMAVSPLLIIWMLMLLGHATATQPAPSRQVPEDSKSGFVHLPLHHHALKRPKASSSLQGRALPPPVPLNQDLIGGIQFSVDSEFPDETHSCSCSNVELSFADFM